MNVSFAPLTPDAVAFLSDRVGVDFSIGSMQPPIWFCCTALDDEGRIMGVLACEFRHPFDAHFTTAIDDPRCLSRRLLRAIFTALFSQAVRVTAEVDPFNDRAMRQMKRIGFEVEGLTRRGLDGERDAVIWGMLREDCKYLNVSRETQKRPRHGQDAEVTRSLSGR